MRRLLGTVRTRPLRWVLVAAVLATSTASACGGGNHQASPPSSSTTTTPPYIPAIIEPPRAASGVTVQQVLDVRTVRLSDGEELKVRGLATPDACWADAAGTFARTMLLEKPVEPTPEGSLRLADGTDYAVLAVELGMVRNDAADDATMKAAEEKASAKKLGRWGPPCVPSATSAPTTPPPSNTTPPAPKPVTGCSVEYRVTNTWPGGFRTDVTIRNTGTTDVTGWTLQWKFPNGQTVSEMWNATSKQSGAEVAATAMPYNQAIARGESVLMGFTGSGGGNNSTPGAFSLNGFSCTRV
ncbi:cellulose binding domain-containing protein [Lentzea sp. NPDC005914]|uniref:cellulose binding domain-containing protein n=1 Tax=Lentzea sp. NPDC005914 TaxID=3154572 RepID=UPI0033FE254A